MAVSLVIVLISPLSGGLVVRHPKDSRIKESNLANLDLNDACSWKIQSLNCTNPDISKFTVYLLAFWWFPVKKRKTIRHNYINVSAFPYFFEKMTQLF